MNFFRKETMPNDERPPMKNFLKLILPVLSENNIKEFNQDFIPPLREATKNFPLMKENPLLNILKNEQNENKKYPIWFIRNSGRYLPEFRELRLSCSYFDLCDNVFGSTEASLQPYQRFKLDGIMIFSDFLTLLRSLGKNFEMDSYKGAFCLNPLQYVLEINDLVKFDPNHKSLLSFYYTIFLTRLALKGEAAVIGYAAGPFTLFSYLVEQVQNGSFQTVKTWINSDIEGTKQLLNTLAEALYLHVLEQINAGAQIIAIFEIFSDILTPEDFKLLSYDITREILTMIKKKSPTIPIIYSPKGQAPFLKKLLKSAEELPFDCISIDYNCDLEEFAELCEIRKIALSGNLDSGVLMGSKEIIRQKTLKMIKAGNKCSRFIPTIGLGLFQEIDPKKVEIFVNVIRESSK